MRRVTDLRRAILRKGAANVFRVLEFLFRQRVHAINALRGYLTEFGQVVRKDAAKLPRLAIIVDYGAPERAVKTSRVLVKISTGSDATDICHDLPLNFYPAATGVRLAFTPIGAG